MKRIFTYFSILTMLVVLGGCTAIDYAFSAMELEKKGQYDEVIKKAKQGIAIDPKFASNWYWMGVAYYQKGNYDEAIPALKKVIDLGEAGPKLQSSYDFLGWAYFQKGNYDEAIRHLNKAIELEPTDNGSLRGRGWAKHHKGSFSEALSDFNKALENIEPKNRDSLKNALRGKAFSYLGLGDMETAIGLIKKAKEASDYDTNHDLSLIYYVMGDKEKAWEYRGGRGMVGVQVKDYNKGMIRGAEAINIVAGGPAEKAGMLIGDIILKLNDADITGIMGFANKTRTLIPGTIVKIKVLREGIEKDISLPVASAEALMEENPYIAPIIAKKKGKPETIAKLPQEVSPVIKSDVDELPADKLPSPRPDTFAVVVGIDYKGRQDIPNLQYAAADAKKIYNILTNPRYGGVPKENAVLLINEKATRNEMIAALRKIKTWDGYVYVYFSGHGAPKTKGDKFIGAFLVPYDVVITDPEAMEETAIKVSYLQELVETSNAKGVMLALDACFSGGGKSIVPKGGKPLVGMLVSPELIKTKGTGRVIITSSATNEQSWEDETELKSGIFSHYLLEGLKGKASKDVWVKVDELAEYIKDNVTKAARKLKGQEQQPQITGSADFAVTRNWERAKVMDIEIAREKLKGAFERDSITAKQLNKALDELKTQKRSKTLEAFLGGEIDERKFGGLY